MKLDKLIKKINEENAPPDGWKDEDKLIPMTKEEEYRNADVPMPEEEITSKDYYAPGSSWIQDQEEYSGAKAYSEFLRLFFKGKK